MPCPSIRGRLPLAFAVATLWTVAACSPPAPPAAVPKSGAHADHDDADHDDADHDHADHDHAHPKTLAAGVAELATVAAAVKSHLAADARDDADDAVHALGHLLEDLQGLFRQSDLAEDTKAAAAQALDDLFECFDKLDTALHAERGTGESPAEVHASHAERIDAAIEALRQDGASKAANEIPQARDEASAIIPDDQKTNVGNR